METGKRTRAEISRENGAKSKGPVTPAGKTNSSRNALKTGEYARKHAGFLPVHPALLCNEDTDEFRALAAELVQIYRPANQLAHSIVRAIAIARWQIDRLNTCITMHWNLALVDASNLPNPHADELLELHSMARSSAAVYSNDAIAQRFNRQIDQLELRITRLERRLKFVHANFPNIATEQTQQPVENTENTPENEPPLYVTENTPAVIAAYKAQYPHRKIVILAPDNVAKGIDVPDDLPFTPRTAA